MEAEASNSLSNLPDDILHHILSFLNITELATLRVLSRRFQTLSTTAPSLSLCFSELPYDHSNCSCPHVFNFMNTLLQRRPHAFKIYKLCFSSPCEIGEHRSLHDEWINNLFRTFCVDKLYLNYQLPSIFGSLPRFQSLKILILNMTYFSYVSVKLLEMKIASLETLFMGHIETEDSVGEWVSQSFPSLKSLFLYYIKVAKFSIRSSSLEDLSFLYCCDLKVVRLITENLRSMSYVNKNYESVVEISAPNLQGLSCRGYPPRLCYDARTFRSLHVASFTGLRFNDLNLTIQLFEAIRWARLLQIDTHMLRDLYERPSFSFGNVPDLEILVTQWFYHYKSFSVSEEDYDNMGDVLITFMKRISNIETLTFVSEPPNYFEVEAEEDIFKEAVKMCEKRTKWKEIKGVKKVKFKIRSMYYSMALLIGMLKMRCTDLIEMTLNYPSCYHESMTLYLNSLESASSALSINCVSF